MRLASSGGRGPKPQTPELYSKKTMIKIANDRRAAITRIIFSILPLLLGLLPQNGSAETDPKFYAVEVSANARLSPPQITLSWPADPRATTYQVYRKAFKASSWNSIATLPGSAIFYSDNSVSAGAAYEYQIAKTTSYGYKGYGYIYAGLQAPPIEYRGKVVLVVENTYAADLSTELARLERDLIGDGWTVLRHDVSRNDSPSNVKKLIVADFKADPANVRSVFLFGNVPVPYSGDIYPDRHPEHTGAWPADAYYGDMDGNWTDASVDRADAARQKNWNVPGDGKFDQSELPSDVELEVGRVDLSNMTCFANKTPARSEKDLLRQYLNKDHNFRHRITQVPRRGLVCDNFGEKNGEAFAASGWRNFAPFFGAANVSAVTGGNYFPTVRSQGYLWSYGTGGGSYYTCAGVGGSDDFASNDIQSVFTMFLGSYFGDWDNESNFLRAPLGSTTYGLTAAWAGRPHWFFHHMALGETIGYSTRLTQNNGSDGLYAAQNIGTRSVHVALMGDPTLRLHPVAPPSSFKATPGIGGVALSWASSPDTELAGYYLYRAESSKGPFTRIGGSSPIVGNSYVDTAGASHHTYMVRALKIEQAASGSYFNPSQGIFSNDGGGATVPGPGPVVTPPNPSPSPSAAGQAVFVKSDAASAGNWKNVYGKDGYQIMGDSVAYPSYAIVTSNGKQDYVWKESTTDSRALQRANTPDRIASCWYADPGFSAEINFTDGKTHRLSLYCLDWDTAARAQTVELLDATSGALLDRQSISGFNRGVYLVWDVKGGVKVRFNKLAGNNAVLTGLFFDPAGTQLVSPSVTTGRVMPDSATLLAGGKFQFRIAGSTGQKYRIEASNDCLQWTQISEIVLTGSTFDFIDQTPGSARARFYRAVPVP
jgi:hypothetical protein